MTRTVLAGAAVLRPEGTSFAHDTSVVVEGGRIVSIGDGDELATGATTIEVRGQYVVPGFIDSHCHLISRSRKVMNEDAVMESMIEGVLHSQQLLRAGVTTVRDAGCRHDGIYVLRRAIDEGILMGPRTFVAGLNPTGQAAPRDWRNVIVSGPGEMRQAVDEARAAGVDWIKLILSHATDPTDWEDVESYLDAAEISAAVERAHELGLRVGCHCEGWEVARAAVECGIDCLDHAPLIDADLAEKMAAAGTGYVPTLWAFTLDTGLDWDRMPDAEAEAVRRWQDEHRASIRRARESGVVLGVGTDAMAALPEPDVFVRELDALVEAGLSTREALSAATMGGARILGAEADLGSIEVGKVADLVVVDDNPLEDLHALAGPTLVLKSGEVVWDRSRAIAGSAAMNGRRRQTETVTNRWG